MIPKPKETIYFELPLALQQTIKHTRTEVHILFFDPPPASARQVIADPHAPISALKCSVYQIDDKGRTTELQTEWHIPSRTTPVITLAPRPFRPTPASDMQQITAEVLESLEYTYEYLFESDKVKWEPLYDLSSIVRAPSPTADSGIEKRERKRSREDDAEWYLVRGLKRLEEKESLQMQAALRESSPESESFVLFSVRRRRLGRRRSK